MVSSFYSLQKKHFKNIYIYFKIFLYFTATSFVTLDVKYKDIVKLLIHFGKAMPVLFFYTSPSAAAMIRELLGMQDPKGPYYDPAGKGIYPIRILYLCQIIILSNIYFFNLYNFRHNIYTQQKIFNE